MGRRRSASSGLPTTALVLLTCWLHAWQQSQMLMCGLGRPAASSREIPHLHLRGPGLGSARPGAARAWQLFTLRRSAGISTSNKVQQHCGLDSSTLEEKVWLVQELQQNRIPALLERLRLSNGQGSKVGKHVHQAILMVTETAQRVRIDMVSSIGKDSAAVRITIRKHGGIEDEAQWKLMGNLAKARGTVMVRDLWEAALSDDKDIVNSVAAAATAYGHWDVSGYQSSKQWLQEQQLQLEEELYNSETLDPDLKFSTKQKLKHVEKSLEIVSKSYDEIRSITIALYKASTAVITHACLVHEEARQVAYTVDVLQTAIDDLGNEIDNAKSLLESSDASAASTDALAPAFAAVGRVCSRADALFLLLEFSSDADHDRTEAEAGVFRSFGLACETIGASLVVPGAVDGSLVLAEEVAVLRQALVATDVCGPLGTMVRELKRTRTDLVAAMVKSFIYTPESFDIFYDQISMESAVREIVCGELRRQLLSTSKDAAVDFIAGVRNKQRLMEEDILDRKLMKDLVEHFQVEWGVPLDSQAKRLLRSDKFERLVRKASEQGEMLQKELFQLPASASVREVKKCFRNLAKQIHPDKFGSRLENAMKTLVVMKDALIAWIEGPDSTANMQEPEPGNSNTAPREEPKKGNSKKAPREEQKQDSNKAPKEKEEKQEEEEEEEEEEEVPEQGNSKKAQARAHSEGEKDQGDSKPAIKDRLLHMTLVFILKDCQDFLFRSEQYFQEHFAEIDVAQNEANAAISIERQLVQFEEVQKFKRDLLAQQQMYIQFLGSPLRRVD